MTNSLPLEGVRLYAPDLYTGVIRARMTTVLEDWQQERQLVGEALIPYAQAFGATILNDYEGGFDPTGLDDPNAYTLYGSNMHITELDRQLRSGQHDDGVRRPATKLISDCTDRELEETPYVFYSAHLQQGVGKYLIEAREQAHRVQRARADGLLPDSHGFLERREFIPTASDHYTSYRIVVGPTGEVEAAGLIYSGHTQRQFWPRRIRSKPSPFLGTSLSRLFVGDNATATPFFEDPSSPYFLRSRDFRSNIAQGGDCIPLMGENCRPITKDERKILQQEGLNPDAIVLSPDILGQVQKLQQIFGRAGGMAVGYDFAKHAGSKEHYLLEVNFGIGLDTYRACSFGGDESIKEIEIRIALGRQMLHRIVQARCSAPTD